MSIPPSSEPEKNNCVIFHTVNKATVRHYYNSESILKMADCIDANILEEIKSFKFIKELPTKK